jgi:hypothetical protein
MTNKTEPVYLCQSKWEGVRCGGDGVERFMINNKPFSLAGAQMKLLANKFYICDDCWPKARPFLLKQLGHPDETVHKAAIEAGLDPVKEGL